MMATRWREEHIETMLSYRDQGLTEAKIAAKLNLIFMTDRFSKDSVNRKIRDLKRSGYLEKNKHSGRWSTPLGAKREGENYEKERQKSRNKGGRPRKNFRQSLRRNTSPWDGYASS